MYYGRAGRGSNLPKIITERRGSLTSVASLVTAKALKESAIAGNYPAHQIALAEDYFNWVSQRFAAKNLPLLSEWVGMGNEMPRQLDGSGQTKLLEKYYLTLSERFLDASYLEPNILALIKPGIEAFIEDNMKFACDVDIIVATHAMTLVNNSTFGTVYNSFQKPNADNIRPFASVVIDEADLIGGVALQYFDRTFNVNYLERVAKSVWGAKKRKLGNQLRSLSNSAAKQCAQLLSNGKRYNELIDYEQDDLLKVLLEWADITCTQEFTEVAESFDLVEKERIRFTSEAIFEMNDLVRDIARSDSDNYMRDKMQTKLIVRNDNGNHQIAMAPLREGGLVNRMWRVRGHRFERIMFTSACLSGFEATPSTSFSTFKDRVGIDDKYDELANPPFIAKATGHGAISRLVLTDPAINQHANPSDVEIIDDPKSENSSGVVLSRTHTDFLVRALLLADQTPIMSPHKRTLVLFPSAVSKMAVYDALPEHIKTRVVGAPGDALLKNFTTSPDGYWFGHNWHGFNFVDQQTKTTLLGRVIISKVPNPPLNLMKAARNAGYAFHSSFEDGAAKVVQGIGRGIRNPQDKPEAWVLDPRMSIPKALRPRAMAKGIASQSVVSGGTGDRSQWAQIAEAIPKRLYQSSQIEILKDDGKTATLIAI
jgi:hypothetical protein